jgi:hypothetical protein
MDKPKENTLMQIARHHLAAIAQLLFLAVFFSVPAAAQDIPEQISDAEFWRIVTEFSEPGGYFRSDNFISNETTLQVVIPELQETVGQGGVYVGVGPEQNFTYIVALLPKIAFIVDIRRQNMVQHLMYKALIEMSSNRIEFFSRLFSRPLPEDVEPDPTVGQIMSAFRRVGRDPVLYDDNLRALKAHLTTQHGFELSAEDTGSLEYVYDAFFQGGPDITYSYIPGRRRRPGDPPLWQLVNATDRSGINRGYLATEENFQALKRLHEKNLIVPLVGDFAGAKTLLTVGQYVREHHATVTTFYTSNVEQYLFQQPPDWSQFYSNVAQLPVDSSSTFIRSVFNNLLVRTYSQGDGRVATLMSPIVEFIEAFNAGEITSYRDILARSYSAP